MSEIRVTDIKGEDGSAAVNFSKGINASGVCTATSFSGSLAATNLTGTIADGRFPSTLPAASGANLTALNAGNVSSGTLPVTRGGTGLTSIGAANKALKVNSAGNALEYGDAGAWTKITSGSGPASASTAVSIDNIFSDTYEFYKVFISWRQDDWMKLRFIRAAGPTESGSNYVWVLNAVREDNSDFGPSREGGNGQNYAAVTWWDATDSGTSYIELSLQSPFSSSLKTGYSNFSHYNNNNIGSLASIGGGFYNSAGSHKGLTIFGGSGDSISSTNFDYLVLGAKF